MNTNTVEKNLFEIYQRISESNNVIIHSVDPFRFIAHPSSAWPNMIFVPIEMRINFNEIKLIADKINVSQYPKVLIINEHLVTEDVVKSLKEFSFMPIAQWTNMLLEKIEDIEEEDIEEVKIKIVDTNNNAELKEWLKITQDCLFNNRLLDEKIFKNGVSKNFFKLIIGYYNDIAVSTTLLFLGENAGIYMVATLPDFRRRGIGKLMMKYTQSLAYSHNYDKVVLHSTKEGLPLYTSLGYKSCNKMTLFFYINK